MNSTENVKAVITSRFINRMRDVKHVAKAMEELRDEFDSVALEDNYVSLQTTYYNLYEDILMIGFREAKAAVLGGLEGMVATEWYDYFGMELYEADAGACEWRPKQYLNAYMVDRRYGGGEEGGWWYDFVAFDKGMEVSGDVVEVDEIVRFIRAHYDARNKDEERPEIGSTASFGRWQVILEDKPGGSFPTERPHYE